MDLFVLLLGLPAILPVMLLLGILIKLVSRGPVFFRQQRIGYQEKPFTCLKFRTMHVGADATVHQKYVSELVANNLPLKKMDLKGDPRLIPFGSIIRASGLDELAQLINVLFGEMSLVGPRPCVKYEYDQYLPWHKQRFYTPPGLTGLWQITPRGQTNFTKMMELDIEYVLNRSLWWDMKIMFQTVPAVISQVKETRTAKSLKS